VQTTLLGLGIAIILALVTALVGPLFVDWGQYRSVIEAEASRVVGVDVRVAGPIDVRLLPTPSLNLQGVEIRPGGALRPLTARKLAVEMGLGNLLRGQFRASELTIDSPDVTIGLDRRGNIMLPEAGLGFDPDRLAIDRLTIDNGRIALDDGESGTQLAIDNVKFSGDVRSLLGPFRGDGTFGTAGEQFGYRLSGSRRADDGSMKLRLAVDSAARALSFESDGALWVEAGAPRYEGVMTLSRVVGTASPGGQVAMNDPWKVTGKVKAGVASAAIEQLDMQYGPEVRSVRFTGTANLQLGRFPRAAAALNARQVDLDRMVGDQDRKQPPFEMIKSMVDRLAAASALPMPIRLSLGVDSLTVGGGILQGFHGDAESNDDGWTIDGLELRAPGATATRISGKLARVDGGFDFKGPVKVDSGDPTALFAWIEGRSVAGRPVIAPMRGSGELTLGRERIGVEKLSAEIDRKSLDGRLVYWFATAGIPARLDAALSAAELDIDRGIAVGNALFASTSLERPGEVALAIDIGRATYAGVEASQAHAMLTYDHSGLKIERLSIADVGGASIDASGRIDNAATAARGALTLSLAAPRLDGITAITARFMPQVADTMRKYAGRAVPLKITAKLDVEPQAGNAATARTAAKLKLDGKVAGIDVNLEASGAGDIADPAAATLRLDGRLDAQDARALATLIGLDQLVNVDRRPARLTVVAAGVADGTYQVDGKFVGVDTYASAFGTLKLSGDGALDVSLHAADTRLPHRAPPVVPVDLRGHVTIDGDQVNLTGLTGKVAGASVTSRLALVTGQPLRVNGRVDTDEVDAGEVIALLTGAPVARAGASGEWPTDPFGPAALPAMAGRVEFHAAIARWAGGPMVRDLAGAARFEPSGFSVSDVTGMIAEGRLTGDAQIRREAAGLTLQSHVRVSNADLPALLNFTPRLPVAGRVSLDVEAQGQGLSPASLVGNTKGSGTMTVERVEIAGLDPTAIDTAISTVDRGAPINAGRIADIVNSGLDAGKLRLPFAAAPLLIQDGRLQVVNLAAPAQNADVAASLSLGLNDGQVDARMVLTGAPRKSAPSSGDRPAMAVVMKGPIATVRRVADVTPLVNWLTMRSVDQEAKRLDDAEKEHMRLEAAAEALRRQQDTTASAPPADIGSTPPQTSALGHAPSGPASVEAKPLPPPPRRATPPPPPKPPSLMESFPFGGR
jgi:uncharacterized protein involved in outer membrane biogenesis